MILSIIREVLKFGRKNPDALPLLRKLLTALFTDSDPQSAIERATTAALAKRAMRGGGGLLQ